MLGPLGSSRAHRRARASRAGRLRPASCCCWRQCSRSCSPIRPLDPPSKRSGTRSSGSRSATSRLPACRCCTGSTTALLTIFFLVVGLEIKREFTVGHLASRRSAALPIAAAIGGMAAPALTLLALVIPQGPWCHRLGRADGHRHRLRGRADRDDGQRVPDRAADISHGRRDRGRHRRDHRRGDLLFRRFAVRLPRRRRRGYRRRWRC